MTTYQLPFVGLLIGAAGGGLVVVVVITAVAICLCRHANARRRHNGMGGTSSRSGTTEVTAFPTDDTAPAPVANGVYDDIEEPGV